MTALKDALKLEAEVTNHIRDIVQVCEDPKDGSEFNDYHVSFLSTLWHLISPVVSILCWLPTSLFQLVDYLTGEFLDEQYKGQRELAGMISTLDKMMASHGAIGEFLYDKKILGWTLSLGLT